jgi:alkanesulfonate monooxygenase SsuD/methylene tetrahydromethanopterin reductase-like flavin-dependent oxidoreductase (luciferase family)
MKFGLDVSTTGEFADPRVLAQLAQEAEAAGWDGFFVWDVLLGKDPVLDPWVALAVLALATTRIKLGVLVTPLARHRPWLVARTLANLDQISGGRMICTVGLGHQDADFAAFGEDPHPRVRAQKLDEGLAILAGLWGDAPFSFAGAHYTLQDVTLLPRPVQQPRIPIWVVGGWPRKPPFRRAAHWDGVCLMPTRMDSMEWLTVEDFRACLAYVQAHRTGDGPFDVVMSGELAEDPHEARAQAARFAEAGATWWMEDGVGWTLAEQRERIRRGPPHA